MTYITLAQLVSGFRDEVREALGESEPSQATESTQVPSEAAVTDLIAAAQSVAAERPQLAVGQVWSIVPRGRTGMACLGVLSHVSGDGLRAALASDRLWLATDDDAVVPPNVSPTGNALAVHLWRDVPVARASLEHYAGTIPWGTMAPILMALQARLTGAFLFDTPKPIAADAITGYPGYPEALMTWNLTSKRGSQVTLTTGMPLDGEDDPRTESRALFDEATRHVELAGLGELETSAVAEAQEVTKNLAQLILDRLRQALEDVGLAPETPLAGGQAAYAGLVGSTVSALRSLGVVGFALNLQREAKNGPLRFAVSLATTIVEVEFRLADGQLVVAAAAAQASHNAPVQGVRLELRRLSPDGVEMEHVRAETNTDGVVHGARVAADPSGTFELCLCDNDRTFKMSF